MALSNPRRRSVRRVRVGRRRRSNPKLFGSTLTGGKLAQAVAGGLVGVTAAKMIVPALPAAFVSTPIMRAFSSVGVAFGAGWVATRINADLGSAVLFGGLMQAGSVILNAFMPAVGGQFALAGLGDYVPAYFTQPENPIRAAMLSAAPMSNGGNGVSGMRRAFRSAF
jgi:hypothetical protein